MGTHTLTATPYESPDANKSPGTPLTITFAVIDEPVPEAPTAVVVRFVLVDADTGDDIGLLGDGDTINLATLPTRNLNVRAETDPATIGAVHFSLDGEDTRLEREAPYTLDGDRDGVHNSWTPDEGTHTLTATPYGTADDEATIGTPLTITFKVIDEDE